MQIIQNIREKGAVIIIAVIALSLIGFLLMDAKQGQNKLFSASRGNEIGSVNGEAINNDDFKAKVEAQVAQQTQQSQQKPTPAEEAQIRNNVWEREVALKTVFSETKKLGIQFTSKEFNAIINSDAQENPLLQQGAADQTTGMLDRTKLKEMIKGIRTSKGEQRDAIAAQLVVPQQEQSIVNKYMAMLNAAGYYAKWMEEKDKKESTEFANISVAAIPYNIVTDSAVVVKDEDIAKYIAANKGLFKQEAGRKISFTSFSQLPTAPDSAATKEALEKIKAEFATDNNPAAFVAKSGSLINYDSNYIPKSRFTQSQIQIDSFLKVPQGAVYGPVVNNGAYMIAKIIGTKAIADSAKARHILIGIQDQQTGEQLRTDADAKKLADSILTLVKNGGDFAALAKQYSADGSKDKGGDLGTFAYGSMVPEFNEFCFSKSAGTKEVVKTKFGYHIIEAQGTKGNSPAYKVAMIARPIDASVATITAATQAANLAAGEKTALKLDAYLKAKGLTKITVPTIVKENDAEVGRLKEARQLVRWAYEAKVGDVSEVFNIGNEFIVAVLDKVYAEGTQDVETARTMAEAAVKNEKKAALIVAKIGATPTLESAAAAYNMQVQTLGVDSSITLASAMIPGIGNEPKLIGAAFDKANQAKVSAPIIGKTGVFVVKVNSVGTKTTALNDVVIAQEKSRNMGQQLAGDWFETLKKQAKISDKRSDFY